MKKIFFVLVIFISIIMILSTNNTNITCKNCSNFSCELVDVSRSNVEKKFVYHCKNCNQTFEIYEAIFERP